MKEENNKYMKNKKAFTLIELLCVIVIIAVVAVIGTVSMMTIKEKMQKKMLGETLNSLINSAETYGSDNKEIIEESTSERTIKALKRKYSTVTVGELLSAKYYSSEEKDSDGNPSINYYKDNSSINDMTIIIYESNSSGRIGACIPDDAWGYIGNLAYIGDTEKEEFGDEGIYCTEKNAAGGQTAITLSVTNENNWANSKTLSITMKNDSSQVDAYKIVEDMYDCYDLTASTWTKVTGASPYSATKQYITEYDTTGTNYYVCVKDIYDNINNQEFNIKMIDRTPPTISLSTSLVDGYIPPKDDWRTSKSIEANLNDTLSGVSGYKLVNSIDDCNSLSGYTNTSNGTETLSFNTDVGVDNTNKYICVKDVAGNVNNTPIKVQKIDNVKPAITLSAVRTSVNSSTITATITSTPPSGIKGYKFSTTSGSYSSTIQTSNTFVTSSSSGYIYAKAVSNSGKESDEVKVLIPKQYHTITYDDAGGKNPSGRSYYYGTTYPILDYYYDSSNKYVVRNYTASQSYPAIRTVTKNYYTFGGYYTGTNCTGTQIINENGYLAINPTVNYFSDDSTIHACWKYRITFNANGGTVSPTYKDYVSGNTYGTLPTPSRTNYDFTGWYTSQYSGTQITSNMSVSSSRTLYAHWQLARYTVTFNPQGGTVSPTSRTVTSGSYIGTLPTPSLSGYLFQGWYTGTNGQGTKLTYRTRIYETQTVYAYWKKDVVTVTFNADGGSVSPSSKEYTKGSTYGTLPTPTKSGYIFGGWYTSRNGSGTKIQSTSTVSSNITIYAFWYRDVPYLKSTAVTSGNGLYNQNGTYYYKGGGCTRYSYQTLNGHGAKCLAANSSSVNNFIKVGGKLFRILQIDNQGVKIIYDGNMSHIGAYNTSAYTFVNGGVYTYFNSTFLNSISLNNKSSIIKSNATYRQTVDPYYNWNVNGHLSNSWQWYKNMENSYGSNYTATVGLLTASELCYHSSFITTPNSSTNVGADWNTPDQSAIASQDYLFCGKYNWLYFDETNYTYWSYYGYYYSRYIDTMVAFTIQTYGNVYLFGESGFGYGSKSSNGYPAKPVMYLNSTIKFTGSGTRTDPYVVVDQP